MPRNSPGQGGRGGTERVDYAPMWHVWRQGTCQRGKSRRGNHMKDAVGTGSMATGRLVRIATTSVS